MKDIQVLVNTSDSLPTPPVIAMQILSAVKDEDNSFDDLASIVKTDPALTSQILKVANSSLYSPAKQVESLAQATAMIGTTGLLQI